MSEPQGSDSTTRRLPVMEKPPTDELDRSAAADAHDPSRTLGEEDSAQGRFWSPRRLAPRTAAVPISNPIVDGTVMSTCLLN